MVFVPFTDIDNHKQCVTFGAGLLSQDDGVSYEWLLRAFLKAFRKQHQLVLSDQDPALKKAIHKVFPLAHHRLCMWHITKKLPNKVCIKKLLFLFFWYDSTIVFSYSARMFCYKQNQLH